MSKATQLISHPFITSFCSDINGVLLFYRKTKLGEDSSKGVDLITMGFGNLNKSGGGPALYPGLNGKGSQNTSLVQEPDYENLKTQSPSGFPVRPAPRPPAPLPTLTKQKSIYNTLGHNYSELDGVPFQMAAHVRKGNPYSLPQNLFTLDLDRCNMGYDFELERQVLCTTKAIASTNPFFN